MLGRKVVLVAGDLADPAHCRAVIARAVQEFGKIDVLVSDAAYQMSHDSLDEITDQEWDYTFKLNIGAFAVPAFHPDRETLPFADDFTPEICLDETTRDYPEPVPFSAGPAQCPGRNRPLRHQHPARLSPPHRRFHTALDTSTPRLSPDAPLPLTHNNFGLDFAVEPSTVRAG